MVVPVSVSGNSRFIYWCVDKSKTVRYLCMYSYVYFRDPYWFSFRIRRSLHDAQNVH